MQFDVANHALDFGEQFGVSTLCHQDLDNSQKLWTAEDLPVPVDGGIHPAMKRIFPFYRLNDRERLSEISHQRWTRCAGRMRPASPKNVSNLSHCCRVLPKA